MSMHEGISTRIMEFCNRLFDLHTDYMKNTSIPEYFSPFEMEYGKKYVRIVTKAHGQSSVYCFIDMSNGDILKADGWKKPAKGKRGSIWNENCDVGADKPCNVHGSNLYKR